MCDCTEPSVFSSCRIVARVEHTCDECLHVIAKGEAHERAKGLWDGAWGSYRFCVRCDALRVALQSWMDGDCICFGSLVSDLDEERAPIYALEPHLFGWAMGLVVARRLWLADEADRVWRERAATRFPDPAAQRAFLTSVLGRVLEELREARR